MKRRLIVLGGAIVALCLWLVWMGQPVHAPDSGSSPLRGAAPGGAERIDQEVLDRLSWSRGLEPQSSPGLVRQSNFHELKRRSDSVSEYRISGFVRQIDGTPLGDVLIAAYPELRGIRTDDASPVSRSRSDPEGAYEIKSSQPLKGLLVVTRDGYAQVEEEIDLADPGLLRLDYILRPAPGSISGLVMDSQDGRPLPGALVKWSADLDSRFSKNWSPRFVRSGPGGEFEFTDLPLGRGVLSARLPGYFGGDTFAASGHNPTRLLLRMPRGPSITVKVEDQNEHPVRDAFLALPDGKTMRTGRDGSLTITVDPEWERVPVEVWAEGYLGGRFELDGQIDRSVLYLSKAASFSGRVVSQLGRPIPQVSIHVYSSRSLQGGYESLHMTDAAGKFSVPISFPPLKSLRLSHPDFIERSIDPEDLEDPEAEIPLQPRDTGLSGLVTRPDGRPLLRFILELTGESPRGGVTYTRVFEGSSGQFVVTDVPAGAYVAVFAAQEQLDMSRYLVFEARADVSLEAGRITRLDIRTESRQERGSVRF